MSSRFSANFRQPGINFDPYIDEVFSELKSTFMTLPKGDGYVDYPTFERGYEVLKRATRGFEDIAIDPILGAIYTAPIAYIVLRTIMGFTPPEWAYITSERTALRVDQGQARALDKRLRELGLVPLVNKGSQTDHRIRAMVEAAVSLLHEGIGETDRSVVLHRLDKVDTAEGVKSIRPVADLGVPYAVLLYERYMGRPFAGHRDAVSELVGDVVESAVEAVLAKAGVTYPSAEGRLV